MKRYFTVYFNVGFLTKSNCSILSDILIYDMCETIHPCTWMDGCILNMHMICGILTWRLVLYSIILPKQWCKDLDRWLYLSLVCRLNCKKQPEFIHYFALNYSKLVKLEFTILNYLIFCKNLTFEDERLLLHLVQFYDEANCKKHTWSTCFPRIPYIRGGIFIIFFALLTTLG